MHDQRRDGSADDERGIYTVFVGGMTLEEYLRDETTRDDVPSFISPRWLRDLEQRGFLTRGGGDDGGQAVEDQVGD